MGNSLTKVPGGSELNIVDWVIVKGPAGSFLGKPVVAIEYANWEMAGATEESRGTWKAEILRKISDGDCVQLNPVFEFIAPLRPVQDPRTKDVVFARDPVVVSLDFVLHPISLYVKAAGVYFCSDMHETDAESYKSFVEQATDAAKKRRSVKSNLVLVPDLPPSLKKGPPRA